MRARRVDSAVVLALALFLGGMPNAVAHGQGAPAPTRILLLYGVPPESPSIAAFTRRFRSDLTQGVRSHVEFYAEYLDLDRFMGPERRPQLGRYFADKYRGHRIDAIVAVGASALQFAVDRLRGVFPGVPVVFGLVTEQAVAVALPPNVTGRFTRQPHALTVAMARRLQPDAQRIVIVGGAASIDSLTMSTAVREVAAMRDRLEIVELRALALETLLARVRQLPPRTIVLFTTFRRDGREQAFVTAEVATRVAHESNAPVYGNNLFWVGEGIVGGSVIDGDDEGQQIARVALRVLRRGFSEPLPPLETSGSAYVADWRQLQRWGFSERRLPPGTTVLFRASPVWERYRMPFLGILLLVATQSMLIALLWLERRRRIRAQLAVEDRAAYERTMAELTTDAMRHAPEEAPQALESALARVGRYAGASAAVLVQYADAPFGPATRLFWAAPNGRANGTNGSSWNIPLPSTNGDSRLEIPLVADGFPIGALELYRSSSGRWPEGLASRLEAAGELIASAMARSRAAKAIYRGEELNRAVLASLSSQIAILDRNGTIIRVNEAWRELGRRGGVDARRDAFLGESYLDECRRAEQRGCTDALEVRLGIESVLTGERPPFRYEYHLISAPMPRWYELSVERLDYAGGGVIVSHHDITDRRLAELRDEETRSQIAHMGRVAMVGELAAAMSHELRQPLAAIRANAEAGALLLAKDPPDIGEAREAFTDIVDDDVRASEVIDHIRMLLRKQEPTKTLVNLNEVCRQAVHLLRRDAVLRGTTIELALEPRLSTVSGDPVQLQQVVLNLALNALDAVAYSSGTREVIVGTAGRCGEVELFVRDSGPGLAPEVLGHLFESFFSTKVKGLGMGLVIVRTIVERHHGRVRAENHAAGGAVFRVLLPA